ncbi:MAG: hypothetical protein OHK005_10830 [Candidatus Methylacidiphilales bacterium]
MISWFTLSLTVASRADFVPQTRSVSSHQPTSVYYTYSDGTVGGVAAVTIDPLTGKFLDQRSLAADPCFQNPHKLDVTDDGRFLAASSQHEYLGNLYLIDLQSGTARLLNVTKMPDAVEAYQDGFMIGADDAHHYFLDASSQKITRSWNGRAHTYPPGRRIEYITITPENGLAWTSWQKDSPSSRNKGSRVILFDLNAWKAIADLPLPRALPHLHLADFKEQGPNPEIIIPSKKTNTLLLSMDLYGGIAMADLDAAQAGDWKDLSYQTTAPDQTWGTAFPDRASRFPTPNGEFVFVANAGKTGGVAWVDLAERTIVQRIEAPPGLESPVLVDRGKLFVAAALGKTKTRSFGALQEIRNPTPELFTFRIHGNTNQPRLSLKRIPLPTFAYRSAAVAPQKNDIVFLTAGELDATEIMTVHASTGKVIDRRPALGEIERITVRN